MDEITMSLILAICCSYDPWLFSSSTELLESFLQKAYLQIAKS